MWDKRKNQNSILKLIIQKKLSIKYDLDVYSLMDQDFYMIIIFILYNRVKLYSQMHDFT